MKNETISRIILVLEIAAIILFHSLKGHSPADEKIARQFNESPQTVQSSHIVLTSSPITTNP